MSDNTQAPPPSYSKLFYINQVKQRLLFLFYLEEVVDKSIPPVYGPRATTYAIPQQEQVGATKYPTVNPTFPIAYGVQVVPLGTFSRNPVQCTCANCRSTIITRIEQTNGLLAWLICILLVLFGCTLGCCLIPFCISDLQNVQHYCPNCNAFIGEYRPL
jgi:lipopolysaccharide-induced tumor necrosis factor-alpha factor